MASNQCFAYKILKKHIGKQCDIYGRLRQTGDLGSLPGMYVKNDEGRDIPSEDVSAFLRGGIINTMACYEAYVVDLFDEAYETILFERTECKGDCQKCEQLKYDHVVIKPESLTLGCLTEEEQKVISSESDKIQIEIQKEYCRIVTGRGNRNNFEKLAMINMIKEKVTQHKFRLTPSVFHTWINKYSKMLLGSKANANDFVDSMFEGGDIEYYYPVDDYNISRVTIDNPFFICAMSRICYGIRCIMAHGSAESTLSGKGALSGFPDCEKCSVILNANLKKGDKCRSCCHHKQSLKCECQKKIDTLKEIHELSNLLDECIIQKGKRKVLKKSRHFPKLETFKMAGVADIKAKRIIEEYNLDEKTNNAENPGGNPINQHFAYFHMFRVFHWLKENQRLMYVTYRLLLRINQFILVLAHRMRIAVARILIHKHGLDNGIWGVPKDEEELKEKIKKFESKHKKKVEDLQKNDSSKTVLLQVTIPK